jgi:hypothetical protein
VTGFEVGISVGECCVGIAVGEHVVHISSNSLSVPPIKKVGL